MTQLSFYLMGAATICNSIFMLWLSRVVSKQLVEHFNDKLLFLNVTDRIEILERIVDAKIKTK